MDALAKLLTVDHLDQHIEIVLHNELERLSLQTLQEIRIVAHLLVFHITDAAAAVAADADGRQCVLLVGYETALGIAGRQLA